MSKRLGRRFSARRGPAIVTGCLFILLVVVYGFVLYALRPNTAGTELTYARLYDDIDHNKVVGSVSLLTYDSIIVGNLTDGTTFWAAVGGGGGTTNEQLLANAIDKLFAKRVDVRIDAQTAKRTLGLVTGFALPAATLVTGFAFIFLLFRGPSGEAAAMGKLRARRYAGYQGVTFADVAGLPEAVEELREVKDALAAPEKFEALGAQAPRGVLLVGPPGCGKTLLARAVAGEANVPFFSLSGSEFTEALVGVGPARVRDLFKQARAAAPAIIFVDELDAIGRSRGGGDSFNPEGESTLNELLVQLDGFDPASRVLLIAATNRPDILDTALLRKGRFDRQVVIDVPDRAGRRAIFQAHSKGKPISRDVDWEGVVGRTVGFTGADVAATINEAALLATRRRRQAIGDAEIREAIDRVISGPERRSRILAPDERERVAFHEAAHALLTWLLPTTGNVDKVSLIARGHSLGSTWNRPSEDRRMLTRRQAQDELTVTLAGRAAEVVVFGDPSSGAQADLDRATRLARQMVREFGMSDVLGPYVIGRDGTADVSYELAAKADSEVLAIMNEADGRASGAVRAHRAALDAIAERLLSEETLERPALLTLLAGVPQHSLSAARRPEGDAGDAGVVAV